jgi:glutamyl-tRNA reductase
MRQTVRLLSIDLRGIPRAARDALTPARTELEAMSAKVRAAAPGVELVLLADADRFELYTTEEARQVAFGTVLAPLVAGLSSEARASIRTTEAVGVAAAWHLMHLLVDSSAHSGVRMLGTLNVAVQRARATGTLGHELSALFACAADAGWRVQGETTLGDPASSLGEREVDWFEAQRIVEEELVHWQAARASDGVVQSVPPKLLDPSYYAASEPGSSVRLKVPALRQLGIAELRKLA